MSVFWNKRTTELSPYVPGEQPVDRVFIKLNTNENPYPPSPNVIAAMEKILSDNGNDLRLYPDPRCTAFREAAAQAYGVMPEQVFPGNGSDEVLAFVFGALFECGLPVLFPDITYSFYPVYAKLWDIPFNAVPLADDFSITVTDYMVPASALIFPNPNAPTGRALPFHHAIGNIVEYQAKNNTVVVIDEAYAAFGAESAVPFINVYPNLLTVHTLSKSASLAGLRAGFAIGNAELVEGLFRIRDSFNSYTMDRLALAGAAAALADKGYYDRINKKVIATRERTSAELVSMGFEVIPSKANFLFIRKKELSGEFFFNALRDRGILVRHFDKPRIADYLRVSIGTDTDMDAFLEACGKIVEGTK